ncbi:MAG: hypothetical protein EA368_02420 [Leptolyngbya sp. DLM2.Bin27]|nr:MAG: hypothetical protein EA368_02420 [Leptolyngbya sp. DLM2.Bin27]
MEISTFELLVKRIAPPPAPSTLARRVIQGYFLTITNLENRNLNFRIDFTPSIPDASAPDRSDRLLRGRADILDDVAGRNRRTAQFFTGDRLTGIFPVPAQQTASVQLLPRLPGTLLDNPDPQIEIRGFVSLQVSRFQANPPARARVLLNPETRGTFLPNTFPASTTGDFDQINYPMQLASGRGLNTVMLEPLASRAITADSVSRVAANLLDSSFDLSPEVSLLGLNSDELASALAALAGQIEPSDETLDNASDLLSKLNIPIRMERVNR